jgi:CRP-like cAMP-binding protein
MLAGKNIRLCRWNEKLITLISLTVSGSLIFMATRWGLQSEVWQVDLLPMLNFLLPMALVSLAFVLLVPSCFIYQRTGFLIAWLVLAMSLVGMSTANILRFYEESYIETAVQMASRSVTPFYVLSYALLASALFSHYIIYTRVRSNHAPAAGEVALKYDDKQRLRSAFANICGVIFSQFMSIYGERVTRYVQDELNTRSQEAGWKLKAIMEKTQDRRRGDKFASLESRVLSPESVGIEDNVPEELNIISLGEVYRGFLSQVRDLVSNMAGKTFVEKAMERCCDWLYWEEREVADEYLISPLQLSKKLTEEFRMAKKDLQSMLQRIAIFPGLSQEEVFLISSRLQTEKFREGTEMVKQGDLGDKFYIVKSGRVEVLVRDDTNGTERVVAHLSEGDYFGEIALLGDVPRTATCRATAPVEVWVLNKRDFNQLVRRHFDLSEKLDRAVANMTMLKRMPLFRELTYKQIDMILSRLRSKTVPAQTTIIRQGEPGDAFYIIRSGEVMVTAMSETGERIMAELGEAEYFGEIALVTDRPRTATVTSASETELLILEKIDFDAVVKLVSLDLEQAGSRRWLDTRRKLGIGSEESKEDRA